MEEGNVNTVELTEEQEALKMDEFWTQVKEIEECLKKIKRVTEEIEKTHKAALYASNPQESQGKVASSQIVILFRMQHKD